MSDSNAVTAVPTAVRQEIATVQKDITHPYMGVLLYTRDETLRSRGGMFGYQIYDELERDDQVLSCLQKRKNALTAYPWKLEAGGDAPQDEAARQMVERHFKGMNFNRMVKAQLDAILKGYSVGEIMWALGQSDDGAGEIQPVEVKARNQRRFAFDTDYKLRLRTWTNIMPGDLMPDRKFVVHTLGDKDGNPYGIGLGSALFWYVFFKRQNVTFWNLYNDKYSTPTAVGKYPNGTEKPDQQNLLAAIDAIARESGIIIPEGMSIEFLEANRNGTVDAYERLWEKCDAAISKIILGETLTTEVGDKGSYAASQTHNDVRLELTQGDGEELADTLNQTLIAWDVAYNMPGAKPPKLSWDVSPPTDLKAEADTDLVVSQMGFELDEATVQAKYGPGWTKKPLPPPPAPGQFGLLGGPPGDEGAQFSEADRRDIVDGFIEQLNKRASPSITTMVGKVRELVGSAGSLEAIRDGLLTLYPNISPAAFSEALSQGLLTADLAGRFDVKS
jgi:phage gp29-like protein